MPKPPAKNLITGGQMKDINEARPIAKTADGKKVINSKYRFAYFKMDLGNPKDCFAEAKLHERKVLEMSYLTLEEQIRKVPEEYLSDISSYIDYILFRANNKTTNTDPDIKKFFGSLKIGQDGMRIQKELRDEWN